MPTTSTQLTASQLRCHQLQDPLTPQGPIITKAQPLMYLVQGLRIIARTWKIIAGKKSRHILGHEHFSKLIDSLPLSQIHRANGADELCYPGSSCGGHKTWIHCTFK